MSQSISLIFVDGATGIILNESGAWHRRGEPDYRPHFDNEADAQRVMMEYLERVPHSECKKEVNGAFTKDSFPSPHLNEYLREKEEWVKWRTSSWFHRWRIPEPIGRFHKPVL